MRPFGVSVLGLMVIVLVAALAFLGFREQTPFWSGALMTIVVLCLIAAALTAILGRGPRRAFALGFALAGSVFLAWTWVARDDGQFAPVTEHLARLACERIFQSAEAETAIGPNPNRPPRDPLQLNDPRRDVYPARNPGSIAGSRAPVVWFDRRYALQTARSLFLLIVALIGGFWALREHHPDITPRDS